MSKMKAIFDRIDGYRDEILTLQTELTSRVAIGPKNGGTGEHEKAAYLRDRLQDLGPGLFEEIRAPEEKAREGYRPNLLARWEGEGKGSPVWVLSHMDVVPPGDLTLWESDPYVVRVEGDRIFGRGVHDNHHGIISSYLSLKAILESGATNARPVGLIFVADEETGSQFGLDYILRHHGEFFDQQDLIVVPDGGNEEGTMIEVAEKSMLWLKFTVVGKQCHASTPDKGKNSLVGAARLILELGRLKDVFSTEDELFRPRSSTIEPTKMEANVANVNTIPGRDVFYLDCRILPCYEVDQV
ncbi:MAG: M20 family metallo-hydrolase, partial [Deltaproteobacteria bacterium]|nr:M20 family metallo-hydrolase [Deltaproteobacteria bacterium]